MHADAREVLLGFGRRVQSLRPDVHMVLVVVEADDLDPWMLCFEHL